MFQQPSCREDFEVAIICALPFEYDAIALLFDDFWDKEGDPFGRAAQDPNTYTTGRIGKHNVVLALLPYMGKAHAAAAAASMRSSYRALTLLILTGTCGGVPYNGEAEILLGDVVISKTIVQYDFGRKYPNEFIRKNTVEDNLGRPNKNIRSLLAIFNTDSGHDKLQERTAYFLAQLQGKSEKDQAKYRYPGMAEDKLFESSYRHKHRNSVACICNNCHGRKDPVCDEALGSLCDDLGCDEDYLVVRARLGEREGQDEQHMGQTPVIHIGVIASGDAMMKSGEDRDRIAKREFVIAFEMEGAGVWEEIPCIVVKGVCDYTDSHKNETWRDFAAATAASTSKAILERYPLTDRAHGSRIEEPPKAHFLVPFGRNQSFIRRGNILSGLMEMIRPGMNKDDCQRIAIEGLGGVGKTQIALEVVYTIHNEHPDCSIFWVPAVDAASFENAYHDIGKLLKMKAINDDKIDIKQLVKAALSEESSGNWVLVVDNADDAALLFGATGLLTYLPFSRKGSILFTTRNHEATVRLDITVDRIFCVAEMDNSEALSLLQSGLKESQTSDIEGTKRLLDFLANLPLAIRQASAYMATKYISSSEYLELCESEHKDMIALLSRDFEDRHRYKEVQNPVATTWLISFSQILEHDPLAAEYLKFMSILAEKDIPKSFLPAAGKLAAIDAIGTLKAYAFITQREREDSFDMHRLVRLAMRNWLEKEGELKDHVTSAVQRLDQAVPFPGYKNRDVWMKYLPHAHATLELQQYSTDGETEAHLFSKAAHGSSLLGQYQTAAQMHRQALEIREKVLGQDHLDTLRSVNNLAAVLCDLGKYEEAEQMHRRTLKLREKVLSKDDPHTLASMNNLAVVLSARGKYEEAERFHRQARELREKVLGKEDLETLQSTNNLAVVLSDLGKYKEAEQIHRQVLELREKLLGKDHPETLQSMNNLATGLYKLGKHREAEQMHRQALQLREKVLGKDHPDTLHSMSNVAYMLSNLGSNKEAEQMHRQTLQLREKVLGKDHPDTLASMSNLANVLSNLTYYKEAEQMHRQALQLYEKVLGIGHLHTLASKDWVASTLSKRGKHQEARQMRQQTIKLREKVLGEDHPETLMSMNSLAVMLCDLGKYEEAEQMHRRTLELREKVLSKDDPHTLASMSNLAVVLSARGKYEEAERLHQQTLELREIVLGKDHPETLMSINNLADTLYNQNKYEEAERMHRQALKLREKVLGKDHLGTLQSVNNLACVLYKVGEYEKAEQMYRRIVKIREKVLGKDHPETLQGMENLATVLSDLGHYEESEQMLQQTLKRYESALGKDHPRTLDTMDNLATMLSDVGRYEEAERIHRQTLELREKVLGIDHPHTQNSRDNLANCLKKSK